jgi:hypothetical protein
MRKNQTTTRAERRFITTMTALSAAMLLAAAPADARANVAVNSNDTVLWDSATGPYSNVPGTVVREADDEALPAAGAVPEPSSWAFVLIGFAVAGSVMRRGPRARVGVA